LALLLLATAVVLCAAAAVGLASGGEGTLVLLLELREHVVLLGWLALAALTGASLLGLTKLRAPVAATLIVAGVPLMLLASVVSAILHNPTEQLKSETAPGRPDRRLVVVRMSSSLDPVWCVYIHQGNPPLVRRWTAACFNGDATRNELTNAEWTSPNHIRMTTAEGKTHELLLTPTGRPTQTIKVGWQLSPDNRPHLGPKRTPPALPGITCKWRFKAAYVARVIA
jgi:hypothetical protein